VSYPLSFRPLEEMMEERGVLVEHARIHRWAIKIVPVLAAVFRRCKRPLGTSGRMEETYIKVHGQWKYLYRAVARDGDTIDFLLRAKRDKAAAKCMPAPAQAMSVRPCCKSATISAEKVEKVEKVVKPPQKPVMMNRRHSGASAEYAAKKATATPMIYPPMRFEARVPIGIAGK